jgi:hypothetical protein
MKIIYFFAVLIIFLEVTCHAQSAFSIIELQSRYESFKYSEVIDQAELLLQSNEDISSDTLLKIYALKAASHYSLGDQINCRRSFIELLKIDDEYYLDEVAYSPKIVALFNEVKVEYSDIMKFEEVDKQLENTNENEPISPIKYTNNFHTAIAKSIVLPGWGHLQLRGEMRDWILTSVSAAALGSMVYFIIDTKSKESKYLSETNVMLINERYEEFNSSFKIRNTLITAYIALWIYSQIDILFFNNSLGSKNLSIGKISEINNKNKIYLSIQLPF